MPRCPRTARAAVLGLALAVLSSIEARASYQYAYAIQDLGTPGGALPYTAVGINNSGQVAGTMLMPGWSTSAYVGSAGGATPLGTIRFGGDSDGLAINGSGTVAGSAVRYDPSGRQPPRTHAVRGTAGGLEDLGREIYFLGQPSPVLATSTQATGINDAEQVVGLARMPNGNFRGFVSEVSASGQTKLVDIGVLPGGTSTRPSAIGPDGTIVGTGNMRAADGSHVENRAFVARASGTGYTLEALVNPHLATESHGLAVNAAGQVAGYAVVAGVSRAVRTAAGSDVLVDLGGMADGGDTRALAINLYGDLVGSSVLGASSRAILFSELYGGFVDLNTMIDPAAGWQLTSATGINDRGQIVGVGRYQGLERAFILTPLSWTPPGPGPGNNGPTASTPEPSAAVLAALGGLGLLALRARGRSRPGRAVRP